MTMTQIELFLAVSLKAVKVLVICTIYDVQLLATFVVFIARKP